jgi:ribose/xylose/arabinose/galactoside ABC-type transport system permease subunit
VALCIRDPRFFSSLTLHDIGSNIAVPGIMAIGMTLIILGGGIDVSVGALLGLCAVVSGMAAKAGLHPALVFLLAAGVGLLVGSVNGAVSVFGRVHPIIVTLGMMSVLRGVSHAVTGGYQIKVSPGAFRWFGQASWGALPLSLLLLLVLAGLGQFFLSRFRTGRYIVATGSNPRAARLAGIPVRAVRLLTFVLSGFLVGLAGAVYASRMGLAQTATGMGMELSVIATVVIGGTHIMGGSGSIVGTFCGVLLLELVNQARAIYRIEEYYMNIAVGALILMAILTDVLLRSHRKGDTR